MLQSSISILVIDILAIADGNDKYRKGIIMNFRNYPVIS